MDWPGKVVVITGAAAASVPRSRARSRRGRARGRLGPRRSGRGGGPRGRRHGDRRRAGREAEIATLVQRAEAEVGPIALMASNAGILAQDPDHANAASAPDSAWDRSWRSTSWRTSGPRARRYPR